MEVTVAVIAIAGLGMLVTAILGFISLVNPKWFGIQTRKNASAVFFGISFACLVVGIAFAPGASQKESVKPTGKNIENSAVDQIIENRTSEQIKRPIEYEDLVSLLINFNNLTEIQKEEWNNSNQWKRWVEGRCVVSEANSTNLLSEIKETSYEVSCEFGNQDRAILFFSKHMRDQVVSLNKGDVLEFKGRLKKMQDWGFWRSGYVKVE